MQKASRIVLFACVLGLLAPTFAQSQTLPLIAVGTLKGSRAGALTDLFGLKYNLENGAAANLLGGLGSALTYVSGDTFIALPDRGPNAVEYDDNIDNTASYVNRFHTLRCTFCPTQAAWGCLST